MSMHVWPTDQPNLMCYALGHVYMYITALIEHSNNSTITTMLPDTLHPIS
jgi:hypothetical protein